MKSWDPAWEQVFRKHEWGKYPPEELIRFVARNFYKVKDRKAIKVLDVGCGTGAATWYIAREGFFAYGIDGSETAIARARKRFREDGLKGKFKVGDLVNLDYKDEYFDAVVDLSAIQHNTLKNIQAILSEIYRVLVDGGKFFAMMMSTDTWGYGSGDQIEKNTFIGLRYGPNVGHGTLRFFDEKEIRALLRKFKNIEIERSERTVNDQRHKISHWIVSAEK